MPYIRKGGAGRTGSLREQFNYYKRQLQRRLLEEQAFKEARGHGTIEGRILSLFKTENLNYEKVYKEGITRKFGNVTVRITGERAVATQIQSMRARSSKYMQANLFIRNYVGTLRSQDFDPQKLAKVQQLLEQTPVDKLSILIDKGVLPSIQFIYANGEYTAESDEDEFLEELEDALTSGVAPGEVKEIRRRTKAIKEANKIKYKEFGWL